MSEARLDGRVCLVTGANTGIGRVIALDLARRGAEVLMACRSRERTEPVADAIRRESGNRHVEMVSMDLGSLDSVRRCADEVLSHGRSLHVLINNAGVAGQRGMTEDGFEVTFAVNHIGHFVLTLALLGRLLDSVPARIINVASRAHHDARGIDFDALRRPTASRTGLTEYRVSKLANVLFTRELAHRLNGTGTTAYAVHPGLVASDLWRRIPWPVRPLAKSFMITNEEGARTPLYCATAPATELESGTYYTQCRPAEPSSVARDDALASRLWNISLEWTGVSDPTASDRPT